MVKMTPVKSSHVTEIGYDAAKQELHITYRDGKTSIYSDVSPELHASLLASDSVGKALHKDVRGKFPHRYAEP